MKAKLADWEAAQVGQWRDEASGLSEQYVSSDSVGHEALTTALCNQSFPCELYGYRPLMTTFSSATGISFSISGVFSHSTYAF